MTTSQLAIRYDIAQVRQEFLEILSDFSASVQTEKLRNGLGGEWFKQLRSGENQIRSRLNKDFSLVVIGDFKRGKSTLINALLGVEIATTNVTPETVTINEIQYGLELKVEACLVNGGRIRIELEQLKADRLVALLEQLPHQVTHLSIEAPIEWLRGLRLVDTPGTGDIFKKFDNQVHAYLSHADAVFFVISPFSPLSESERAFLQLSVLPQDFSKVFFVANMMDMPATESDSQRVFNAIQTRITRFFPNARLFGISAYDEWRRLQSLPRPNPNRASTLEAEFQAFRDCLQESILLNRDIIQLNRAAEQMEQMLRGLESQLMRLQTAMQSDKLHLDRAIAQCEDESSELFSRINEHKQAMRNEIEKRQQEAGKWMDEFMQRLEAEAIAKISHFKLADIKRHYHFFLTDSLRQAIAQCLDLHRQAILESAEKATQSIFADYQRLTDTSLAGSKVAPATLGDLPWTNLDTLHLVMEYSPLQILAHLFINQVKELGESTQTRTYQERLQKALPQLRHSVEQEIQSLYSSVAEKIEQQIVAAYQQDIEASISAMRQARSLSEAGSQKMAASTEILQEVLPILAQARSSIKVFKQKLWSQIGG